MPSGPFVIVGASLAGARAAAEFRAQGFDGPLILFGEEGEPPYERPPLTKDYLRGESGRDATRVHPDGFYREHDIDLRTGVGVESIDARESRVRLAGGGEIRYERLLLTTGARPRTLDVPGVDLDGVRYMRTLPDCDEIRARLRDGGPLVVVGASWIAMEVAASARQLGVAVTVIAPDALPLERVLGPELGRVFRDLHLEHGVELLLGDEVEGFAGAGRLEQVRLRGGRTCDCALAVLGVGVAPRVELATAAGLAVDDGILVDEKLATSAPAVFAAGDVANAWNAFYGRRIRVEHWANAREQGPAAARGVLGLDSDDRLPYFFSDQFDASLEFRGDRAGADRVVLRGDPERRKVLAFWLAGGVVVAAANLGVFDVGGDIERLIRSRRPLDPAALADPEIPLGELAAGAAAQGSA